MINESIDTSLRDTSRMYKIISDKIHSVYECDYSVKDRLYWYLRNPDFRYSFGNFYVLTKEIFINYD
jgi:hypothetical protein